MPSFSAGVVMLMPVLFVGWTFLHRYQFRSRSTFSSHCLYLFVHEILWLLYLHTLAAFSYLVRAFSATRSVDMCYSVFHRLFCVEISVRKTKKKKYYDIHIKIEFTWTIYWCWWLMDTDNNFWFDSVAAIDFRSAFVLLWMSFAAIFSVMKIMCLGKNWSQEKDRDRERDGEREREIE